MVLSRLLCAALNVAAFTLVTPSLAVASITFSNHTQPSDGDFSGGVATYQHADLNNDGHEDLIWQYTPVMGGYYNFAVELSTAQTNGRASWGTAQAYALPNGAEIYSIVVGDLNHDGNPDVGVFGQDGNFWVFANDGHGNLTANQYYPYAGGSAQAVVADFNHDGILDMALNASNVVTIWWGTAQGTFKVGPSMQVSGYQLMLGDFDGDGKADLLVPGFLTSTAAVYYGDDTGNFPVMRTITAPSSQVTQFSVGDVNSDALSDILYTQSDIAPSRVYVVYGDTTRELASRTSMLTGRCVIGPATVGDLDGNGLNDLIVGERDCGNADKGIRYIDVLARNSNASYQPDQTVFWAQSIGGIVYDIPYVAQVIRGNLDTAPDLLVEQCADNECASYNTTVQFNTTSGSFPTCAAPDTVGIQICSPSSSTGTPVSIAIGASGAVPMRDIEVWIDGVKELEGFRSFSSYAFLNGKLSLSPGKHQMDVYGAGWDQYLEKKSLTVTVE